MAETKQRNCGMLTAVGGQGIGKTYQHMHLIKEYVKDKFYNKVKGRKVLIFDTNGEYTKEKFAKNDIDNFDAKLISLKDVPDWSISDVIDCRRIDAKFIGIPEKKKILEYLIKHFRNGLLCIEDPNTYILSVTHMVEIVGGLVNLRHRGVDVLISYQGLRAVEPRIFANSRWIRLHYQSDDMEDVKGKIPDKPMFKIAQLLVNNRFFNGDKRFFVVIYNLDEKKIEGKFTKQEFKEACKGFLNINARLIKQHERINKVSTERAIEELCVKYYEQYYGNSNK